MFGFLKRFGKLGAENPAIKLKPGRGFTFEIVGESHYQKALSAITGGKTEDGVKVFSDATLRREPNNPYDPNAVRVEISNKTVGYLDRQKAVEYTDTLSRLGLEGRVTKCEAKIVGGWDRGDDDVGHFGVKLNVSWPPKPKT